MPSNEARQLTQDIGQWIEDNAADLTPAWEAAESLWQAQALVDVTDAELLAHGIDVSA